MTDQSLFTDFTFPTSPSPITVRSQPQPQSNAPHPSTSDTNEDDDWGDFIRSPVPSHTQSPPPNKKSSFDSFSPNRTHWEKPKGALPLSLFGEAEDDEGEEQGSAATHPPSAAGAPASDSGLGAISRSVSLPNKSSLIADGTGIGIDGSSGTAKSDSNAKEFEDDDEWEFKVADEKQAELFVTDNGLSKSDGVGGVDSSWNAFSFDQIAAAKSESQLKSGANGTVFDFNDGNVATGDDDDDWGFVDAESISRVGDASSKADQMLENHAIAGFTFGINELAHGPKDMLATSDVTSHSHWGFGFDANPIMPSQDGFTSKSHCEGKPNHYQNGKDFFSAGRNIVTDQVLWGFEDVGKPNDTASGRDSSISRKENDTDEDFWNFKDADKHDDTASGRDVSLSKKDDNTDEDFWEFKEAGKPDDTANGHDASVSRKDDNTDEDFWDFKDAGKPSGTGNGHDISISRKGVNTDEDVWDFKDAGKPDDTANGHVASLTKNKDDDNDKDFWGFKDSGKPDCSSKSAHDPSLAKKNVRIHADVWEFKNAFLDMGSKHQEDRKNVVSPAGMQQLEDNNTGGYALNGTSVASNGTHQYGEWKFGFGFSSVSQGDVLVDSSPKRNKSGSTVESKSLPVDQIVDSDETFWTFESAFSESNVKQKEAPNVADGSAHSKSSTSDTDIKQEIKSEKKEALPWSLFSDQTLEANDSSSHEEIILNTSSYEKTNNRSPSSNIPINDLISNLYNEADKQSPVSSDLVSKLSVAESDLLCSGDAIDDDSWEFKDAFCGGKADDQISGHGLVESHKTVSYRLELNECMELYCKLRDELCSVVLCHLDNLKKAQSSGSLSSQNADVATVDDKEIEEFYNELHQDNLIPKDLQLEETSGNLQEVLGVLQDPKFQVLESELQLSKNISMAEKDLRSAIKLLRHVEFTLRILKMGSAEDQSNYVSTWFRVISVCAKELKHAAFIWKQLLLTDVHRQTLSSVRGKGYILAIGEVYRIVALIQASVKLYKPWIILSSVPLSNMHAVLSECSTSWSSSGLENALRIIYDLEDMEYEGTAEELLESINYIHRLDEFELQSYLFSEQERCCRLSLLKAVVPGLKLETWNGENYFVKLINLWGHMVSSDHSELPCLTVR